MQSPSFLSTTEPTAPTANPTVHPTANPTSRPTAHPTAQPRSHLTAHPTAEPTAHSTAHPTTQLTAHPTVTSLLCDHCLDPAYGAELEYGCMNFFRMNQAECTGLVSSWRSGKCHLAPFCEMPAEPAFWIPHLKKCPHTKLGCKLFSTQTRLTDVLKRVRVALAGSTTAKAFVSSKVSSRARASALRELCEVEREKVFF